MTFRADLRLSRVIDEKIVEAVHLYEQGRIVLAYSQVKEVNNRLLQFET